MQAVLSLSQQVRERTRGPQPWVRRLHMVTNQLLAALLLLLAAPLMAWVAWSDSPFRRASSSAPTARIWPALKTPRAPIISPFRCMTVRAAVRTSPDR